MRNALASMAGSSLSRGRPTPVPPPIRCRLIGVDRKRQAGRCRLDEPQGDPQPARGGRGGGGGDRARLRRQEGELWEPRSFYRESDRIGNVTDVPDVLDSNLAGVHLPGLLVARNSDGVRLPLHRPGRRSARTPPRWARLSKNLVLELRRAQLDQVIQGTHPGFRRRPDHPARSGLFLGQVFLHPDAGAATSAEFYEGRLRPASVTAERTTPFGTDLRFIPVEPFGCRS